MIEICEFASDQLKGEPAKEDSYAVEVPDVVPAVPVNEASPSEDEANVVDEEIAVFEALFEDVTVYVPVGAPKTAK